jgi:DNA-binding IclR family transcriptional regulator
LIQAVDRALRILAVLQGGRRMSLGKIANRLELAPSTVHGIIRTLLATGCWQADSAHRRTSTLRLGNVYLDTLELRARVSSWAEDLARRTGCAVRTGVLLLGDVVVVHHQPRPDGTRQMPEVGIVIPAHASALGKAMLAFAADGARDIDARSMTGGRSPTPHGCVSWTVGRTGIATEVEEACSANAAWRPAGRRSAGRRDRTRRARRGVAVGAIGHRRAADGRDLGVGRAGVAAVGTPGAAAVAQPDLSMSARCPARYRAGGLAVRRTSRRVASAGAHRGVADLRVRPRPFSAAYRRDPPLDAARSYGRAEELSPWLAAHPGSTTSSWGRWGYRYVGDWRIDADVHG